MRNDQLMTVALPDARCDGVVLLHGIAVGPAQRPALHACLEHCCARLGLPDMPRLYLLPGRAGAHRLAGRFLQCGYLALPADVVYGASTEERGWRRLLHKRTRLV